MAEPEKPNSRRKQWQSPERAIVNAAASADNLVPLGDERLDEMLAGGLRRGEMSTLYADASVGMEGVRRILWFIVRNCAGEVGPVIYLALTPASGEARRAVLDSLPINVKVEVILPRCRRYSMDEIQYRVQSEKRAEPALLIIDEFSAVEPQVWNAPDWETRAQVSRDIKRLAAVADIPIIVTCPSALAGGPSEARVRRDFRALPPDELYCDSDYLFRTNGRYAYLIKNRHGPTDLNW